MNQNQIEKYQNQEEEKNSSEENNHSTVGLEFTQDFYLGSSLQNLIPVLCIYF